VEKGGRGKGGGLTRKEVVWGLKGNGHAWWRIRFMGQCFGGEQDTNRFPPIGSWGPIGEVPEPGII